MLENKSFVADITDKYLGLIDYLFENINLEKLPEFKPKLIFQITGILLFFALSVLLVSCQIPDQYENRIARAPLPNFNSEKYLSNAELNKNRKNYKDQEQLFIKRDQLNIREKEPGSSSGSIWADSALPKNLVTDFKVTKPGDVVQVNIPTDLQYKPNSNEQGNGAGAKAAASPDEPLKSFKFEVVGIEPGGDVFLRGVKNYTSGDGSQHNVVVVAKVPKRSINNLEVSANDLTQVAVNEVHNGSQSSYTSTGWDSLVSQKIAGATAPPQQEVALSAEKKDIDTQKKALADQKKSLAEEADRLKKDRARLDAQVANAKNLLDSSTIVDSANTAPSSPAAGGQPSAKTAAPAGAKKP